MLQVMPVHVSNEYRARRDTQASGAILIVIVGRAAQGHWYSFCCRAIVRAVRFRLYHAIDEEGLRIEEEDPGYRRVHEIDGHIK